MAVTESEVRTIIVITATSTKVIEAGSIVPYGAASDTDLMQETAGEIISGHIGVVYTDNKIYKFDPANAAHYGKVHGLTTGSVVLNGLVSIRARNKITNAGGWALSTGPVYLSATGQVTNTAPTTGIIQPFGYAVDADTIFIDIGTPIQQS